MIRIRIKPIQKINIPLLLICCLFLTYYFKKTAIVSSNNRIIDTLNYIEDLVYICCLIYVVLKNKFKISQFLTIGIVGALFLLVAIYSSYAELLKCLFMIVFVKNIAFSKLCRAFSITLLFCLIVTIIMYALGISVSPEQRRDAIALGFEQANALSAVLMMITFLIVVKQRNCSIKVKILLFVMNLAGYLFCDGRAGFGLAVLGLFLTNEKIYRVLNIKLLKYLLPYTSLIYAAISIITAYLYPASAFIQKINLLVTHRIDLNYRNLSLNKIKIFGQKLNLFTTDIEYYNPVTNSFSTYNTVDNVYVSGLIQMGIVAMCIVFLANIFLTHRIYKKNQPQLVIIQFLILSYGLFESSIFSIYVSFVFLFIMTKFDSEKLKIYHKI